MEALKEIDEKDLNTIKQYTSQLIPGVKKDKMSK